ncbi:MAG: glycoside hydrolase family 3 N-terminal domain-containing protein [Sphaerochaeta sp.]
MSIHREKAATLLKKMHLEEKVAQLVSVWFEIHDEQTITVREAIPTYNHLPNPMEAALEFGVGQLTRPYGTIANDPQKQVKVINKIQRHLVENTRLGIPAMIHEECLSGVMSVGATAFPCSLNYGSAWDTELMKKIGMAIGDELRSMGVHQGLSPVLDVSRDARWGRLEETFGEDPYLIGEMAIAYINGLQGKNRQPLATLKHFIGHSGSEGGRNHAPLHSGMNELLNTYGLPFEKVLKHTAVGGVMPAYHDIDGIPCTSNVELVVDLLKKEWGFDGLIVADYEAIAQLEKDHHVAKDPAEAAALALKAGMDIELPGFTVFKKGLIAAFERKLITMEEIDRAVMTVLTEKYRQGIFDNPYIDEEGLELSSDEHHALAVEIAQKSLVLLKNEELLPLQRGKKIALIGPLGNHPYAMYGGYTAPVHLQGSAKWEETVPKTSKTIKEALETYAEVEFQPGCVIFESSIERSIFFPGEVEQQDGPLAKVPSTDTSRIIDAVKTAQNADVVVLVVGDLVGLFQQGTTGEGSDANTLRLPGVQEELMEAVLATGKPTVVLLVSGRPYTVNSAVKRAGALVAAWLPGQGGGEAIAQTLFGEKNFSGKTTLSFPFSAGAMPYTYNHSKKSGGLPRQSAFGARYPFGFGLSYTSFTYPAAKLKTDTVDLDGEVEVLVTVKNTGAIDGEEVVQLYIHDRHASLVRPVKELKGFARVPLKAGEEKTVTFTFKTDLLSFYKNGKRILEGGEFDLFIGSSSRDIHHSFLLTVKDGVRILDFNSWNDRSQVMIT